MFFLKCYFVVLQTNHQTPASRVSSQANPTVTMSSPAIDNISQDVIWGLSREFTPGGFFESKTTQRKSSIQRI